MLAASYRFHGHGSLRFVYAKGRAVRSRSFLVKTLANSRRTQTRAAVVVSKKVAKSAVTRNRIRRRVYEAIRQEIPKFASVYDVTIIITSSELLVTPYGELIEQLQRVFTQAGLYKTLGK